jgi:periplasmic protein CpxP/Spy
MNGRGSYRIWQWAVVLLIICNMGLILTVWLRPCSAGAPPQGGQARDRVIRDLRFDDAQVKQYDELIRQHQQAMRPLRDEAARLHRLLFANLGSAHEDQKYADSLSQLIGANQQQTEMVTFRHFAAVRAMCTDGQKPMFDNIIADVMRQMGGRPGPRPEGEPGPPPPDGNGPPPPPQGH